MANKKLNRTSEHRKALLKNMLNSLIKYEQIKTTLPKAKFLKPQADKIITLGKKETLHTTKMLVSQLQDIKSANKVKKTLSKRYEKRNGGYTRIIKAGFRYGDNAPMAIIEFVDRDDQAKRVDKPKKDVNKEKYELPRFPINENYGEIKRFTSIIKTYPLEYKNLLPKEKKLNKSNNPPIFSVEFFENQKNINNINCYSNEGNKWEKSNISFTNKTLSIKFREPFLPRRGRINCSLNDDGKWRWFGTQFIIINN